jgi:hypothetical protein
MLDWRTMGESGLAAPRALHESEQGASSFCRYGEWQKWYDRGTGEVLHTCDSKVQPSQTKWKHGSAAMQSATALLRALWFNEPEIACRLIRRNRAAPCQVEDKGGKRYPFLKLVLLASAQDSSGDDIGLEATADAIAEYVDRYEEKPDMCNMHASTNLYGCAGVTPLRLAVQKGMAGVVVELLSAGASISNSQNVKDYRGGIALHDIARAPAATEHEQQLTRHCAVKLLDGHVEDVFEKDFSGNLPLHLACAHDNVKLAELLADAMVRHAHQNNEAGPFQRGGLDGHGACAVSRPPKLPAGPA